MKLSIRSLFLRGIEIITITSVLFILLCCTWSKTETDKSNSTVEVTTTCATTSMTSLSTTKNTTTTTTTTTNSTTTTSTVETILTTETRITTIQTTVARTESYSEPELTTSANSDVILIAKVINKEASATYEGKLAVASVIVNRANHSGKSIAEVIYEPNQFSVVGDLDVYTDADYQAASEVLSNGSVNNAYYFDGCHPDGLNHFRDINNNYVGAW